MYCQTREGFKAESQHPEILCFVGGCDTLANSNKAFADASLFSPASMHARQFPTNGLPP
jgi:hypothetical protein